MFCVFLAGEWLWLYITIQLCASVLLLYCRGSLNPCGGSQTKLCRTIFCCCLSRTQHWQQNIHIVYRKIVKWEIIWEFYEIFSCLFLQRALCIYFIRIVLSFYCYLLLFQVFKQNTIMYGKDVYVCAFNIHSLYSFIFFFGKTENEDVRKIENAGIVVGVKFLSLRTRQWEQFF